MNEEKIDILVVDDRPQNIMALEATLSDMGLNIVKAGSGREALREVLKQDFAVILLDVQMPEMDGFETAELIRQRQRSEHTPIIFITANSSDEGHFIRGYSLGAVDYLPKPFRPEILRSKIAVFVELFRKSEEVQRQAEYLASVNQKLEQEIYERKRAEEAIRESESRFRAMFENAGIGMSLRTLEGRFLKANAALERIVGYPIEELAKLHFTEITHPSDSAAELDLYQSLVKGSRDQYQMDKRYIRRNGDIIWARVVVSAVKGADGKPVYAVCMSEDITSQKLYTEQLQKLTEELARSNSELIIAKEGAEQANKAKTIFLSNMSHELRTPLNAILGFAQILKKDRAIPEQQRGFLDTMYRSGSHLLEMINDLLDNSKIESGKMDLYPQDFNLHSLLDELADMFTLRANEKGIILRISYDEETPEYVYADAKRLRQILINLLGNAVKFTSEGEIHLKVVSSPLLRSNGKSQTNVKFIVSDTGRGIPKDQLQNIFEPFNQTSGSYSEGSGLGLAISRRIAHLMHGEISVESNFGKGSVFTFELQLQIPETDRKEPKRRKSPVVGIKGDKRYKVLIAADDESKRRMLRNLLETAGFICAEAADIQEACKKAKTFEPGLLLADTKAIKPKRGTVKKKDSEQLKSVPAIALVQRGAKTRQGDLSAAGFEAVVHIPLQDNELFETIARILELEYIYEERGSEEVKVRKPENPEPSVLDIVAAIRKLPEQWSDALVEAVEVQDLDHIQSIVNETESAIGTPSRELKSLFNAAHHARYKFLYKISEELRKGSTPPISSTMY